MGKLDKGLIIGIVVISAATSLAIYMGGRVVETKVVNPMLARIREKKAQEAES